MNDTTAEKPAQKTTRFEFRAEMRTGDLEFNGFPLGTEAMDEREACINLVAENLFADELGHVARKKALAYLRQQLGRNWTVADVCSGHFELWALSYLVYKPTELFRVTETPERNYYYERAA